MVFSQIDLLRRVEGWEISTSLMRSTCRYVQKQRTLRTEFYDTLTDLRKEYTLELGVGRVHYNLMDEESRIDLNTASESVLARLPGFTPDLARNIVNSPLRPFAVLEELLLVEGFDAALLGKCRDWVTVFSNGRVNINTAPVEVLQAVGVDAALAGLIADFRLGPDRVAGTDDDGYFADIGEIDVKLKSFSWLSDEQKTRLADLLTGATMAVASENFTLQAQTVVLGKPAMKYAVTFNKDRVRRWQEQ